MQKRVKPSGVASHNSIDKTAKKSYYLSMLNAIKNKYYTYKPGEFLPVRSGGELLNKRDFHAYRIKKILGDPKLALYQFTHYAN